MSNARRDTTPTQSNGWGIACAKCGHPATYHGMTFCHLDAGAASKRLCDCTGYSPWRPNASDGDSSAQ